MHAHAVPPVDFHEERHPPSGIVTDQPMRWVLAAQLDRARCKIRGNPVLTRVDERFPWMFIFERHMRVSLYGRNRIGLMLGQNRLDLLQKPIEFCVP